MKKKYQKILILYLKNSSLDSEVISWGYWDGSEKENPYSGNSNQKPYKTGLDALRDEWRLIQISPVSPPSEDNETSIFNYEFVFEKLIGVQP